MFKINKWCSLPYGTKPEYPSEPRNMLPNQRSGWQHTPKHRSNTSKKQEQSHQYKKHSEYYCNLEFSLKYIQ